MLLDLKFAGIWQRLIKSWWPESFDLPAYALKRLFNHKMTHDVTAGYIMGYVERLRKPMQRISDYLIRQMLGSLETVDEVV